MKPSFFIHVGCFLKVAASVAVALCMSLDAAAADSSANGPESSPTETSTTSNRLYSEAWSNLLDDVATVATILAIVGAAAWAYFNFIKGRVYSPRLELGTSAALTKKGGTLCLHTTIDLKNVGLSKVPLKTEGTVIRISACQSTEAADVHAVDWDHVGTFGVFSEHQWIEPGEVIKDQQVFVLPQSNYLAFQIAARVVSSQKEWNATAIATERNGTVSGHPSANEGGQHG